MPGINFYLISNNNILDNENCGICLDPLKNTGTIFGHTITLADGKTYSNMHQFHKICLQNYLQVKNSCPSCTSLGNASVDLNSIFSLKDRTIIELKHIGSDVVAGGITTLATLMVPQIIELALNIGVLLPIYQIGSLTVSGNPLSVCLIAAYLRMIAGKVKREEFNADAYLDYGLVAGLTGGVSLLANATKDIIGASNTIIAGAATGAASAIIAARAKVGAAYGIGLMGLWLTTAMIASGSNTNFELKKCIVPAATALAATWTAERHEIFEGEGIDEEFALLKSIGIGCILTTALQIPYQWPEWELDAAIGCTASVLTSVAYTVLGNERLGILASAIAGVAIGVISQKENVKRSAVSDAHGYTMPKFSYTHNNSYGYLSICCIVL